MHLSFHEFLIDKFLWKTQHGGKNAYTNVKLLSARHIMSHNVAGPLLTDSKDQEAPKDCAVSYVSHLGLKPAYPLRVMLNGIPMAVEFHFGTHRMKKVRMHHLRRLPCRFE